MPVSFAQASLLAALRKHAHLSGVHLGVRDYNALISEIAHVLRPGGLVLLVDTSLQAYDANHNPINPFHQDPCRSTWLATYIGHVRDAMAAKGGNPCGADFFDAQLQANGAFGDITIDDVWLCVGKWFVHPRESYAVQSREKCD